MSLDNLMIEIDQFMFRWVVEGENDTSTVWTQDVAKAMKVAKKLNTAAPGSTPFHAGQRDAPRRLEVERLR